MMPKTFLILLLGLSSIALFKIITQKRKHRQEIITFPMDVLAEIFKRTPIKSLQICKCVCKAWFQLINDPSFVIQYSSHSRNEHLIFSSSRDDWNVIYFLKGKGPPTCFLKAHQETVPISPPQEVHFEDFVKNAFVAGSTHGLVCLASSGEFSSRYLGVWNPATMMWKLITLPATKIWENMSCGFGYDNISELYMLICLVRIEETDLCRLEMCSVRNNCWYEVNEDRMIRFVPQTLTCDFVLNGNPYWVGKHNRYFYEEEQNDEYCLLAKIDATTGQFTEFGYPHGVGKYAVHVVKMRDSVAALVFSPILESTLELYLLNEVNKEWSFIHNIGPFDRNVILVPKCLTTGEIVIVTMSLFDDDIFLWDTETRCLLRWRGTEDTDIPWFKSYTYLPGLASIEGMRPIAGLKMEFTGPEGHF